MRVSWIDALKGLAIILVAFGHVEIGYGESGIFPEKAWILQMIWDFGHTFRMPLFFLLSGYLYEMTWNERRKISGGIIRKKFLDIGILYLLFSALFWMFRFIGGFIHEPRNPVRIEDLIQIPIVPFEYLWFLWVLALLFVVVPCLVKVCSHRLLLVGLFSLGYLLPWQDWMDLLYGVTKFFYGGFYFVLGSYCRMKHFETAGLKIRHWMMPFSLLICVGNCAVHFYFGKDIWPHPVHEAVIALAACYVIWYVFIAYWDQKDWPGNRFFKLCGQKSLEIYLLHMYLAGGLRAVFHKVGVENLWLLIAVGTVIAVLVPLGIALLADRWKWVHDIFHPADWLRGRGLLRE